VAKDLREFAEGKPCYARWPGCSHDRAETVLAHIRRGNVAGGGQKPPDVCGLPLCNFCHAVFDGRIKTQMTREQMDADLLRAMVQWHAWLWENEYLIAVIA
jgi:hypothetical protein